MCVSPERRQLPQPPRLPGQSRVSTRLRFLFKTVGHRIFEAFGHSGRAQVSLRISSLEGGVVAVVLVVVKDPEPPLLVEKPGPSGARNSAKVMTHCP